MSAPTPPLRVGDCQVSGLLGAGGMGQVLRGVHTPSGAEVAVKLLTAAGAPSRALHLAFGNEVRAVAALNHPNIVPILDYGALGEDAEAAGLPAHSPYLVMPLVRGGTLQSLYGRMRWPQLLTVLEGTLAALSHAHARGVLHRDIKPGNVLLREPGDPSAGVLLADFGLASLDDGRFPESHRLQGGGTPGYRPPEQERAAHEAQGPWSDLYALGRLCMRFEGRPLRPPPDFWDWVLWLADPDPHARPAFAEEAAEALRALSGAPNARPGGPSAEPRRSPIEPAMSLRVLRLREPSFVAREDERARLWTTLEEVIAMGRPLGVGVLGPRGMGRTRVARWLGEQAHQAGRARALSARLQPARPALAPIEEGLARLLGLPDLPAAAAEAQVERELAPRGWSAAERRRLLTLLAPSWRHDDLPDPPERRALLRRALLDLSRGCPLVLILDDLHHAPEAAALASSLLSGAGDADAALLLVWTAAPLRWAELPEEARATLEAFSEPPIHLGRLPADAHRRLVDDMLGAHHARLGEVHARSSGDPGLAVALARSLVDPRLSAGPLPSSLAEIYAARAQAVLDDLDDAQRGALSLAALLGERIRLTELRAACKAAQLPLSLRPLERLAQAGLILRDADGLRFLTPLVRETFAALTAPTRALHAACARAVPDDQPGRAGLHHLRAGEHEPAVRLLTAALSAHCDAHADFSRAAHVAEQLGEALLHFEGDALDPLRLEAEFAIARHQLGLERPAPALAGLRSVAERAQRAGRVDLRIRARHRLTMRHRRVGDFESIVAELQSMRPHAKGQTLSELLKGLYYGLWAAGRAEEALEVAEEAGALAERLDDAPRALHALRLRVLILTRSTRYAEASPLLKTYRRRAEARGDTYHLGLAWNATASLALVEEDLERAERALAQSSALLDAISAPDRIAPRLNLGVLRVRLGRHAEARPLLEACVRELRRMKRPAALGYAQLWRYRALAELGQWGALPAADPELDVSMVRRQPEDVLENLRACVALADRAHAVSAQRMLRELLQRAEDALAG